MRRDCVMGTLDSHFTLGGTCSPYHRGASRHMETGTMVTCAAADICCDRALVDMAFLGVLDGGDALVVLRQHDRGLGGRFQKR